ncbi:MAG: NAD(P)/FAD-dependent oxidoreductase [Novosphingobium sp.]
MIVGAGFAGMYMLHALRGLGLSAKVIEAATDVGGTWYWNRYPGARCDVQSIDYSYSFSDEIQKEWTWTERFSAQPEILAYARYVADKLDIRRDIQFETRVLSAHFHTQEARWLVATDQGDRYSAKYLIMATGPLSQPKIPDLAGLESFKGDIYYTSRWPKEPVHLKGKRVGVIGTGSTAIQAIPAIAEQNAEVVVFQRTPAYTLPAGNHPLDPEYMASIKQRYHELRDLARTTPHGGTRPGTVRTTFSYPGDERRRIFEEVWQKGGQELFGFFGDLMVDEEANAEIGAFVREKISQIVKDPEVAEALKPYSYPLGARRLCLDTNYYATYNRPNVKLVDVAKDPIERITETGIKTGRAHYPLDVLVVAVGFDAITGAIMAIDIRNGDGALRDKWLARSMADLGIMTAGFPNLFMVNGPGSPSVLGNVIATIEQHVEFLRDLIEFAQRTGVITVEADPASEQDWMDHVQALAQGTLFMKANSWYLGSNIEGKPRMMMPYVGGLHNYRKLCDDIVEHGFKRFVFTYDNAVAEDAGTAGKTSGVDA